MLEQSPQSFGYEETEWTKELVQVYMESKMKINLTSAQWQVVWKLLQID
ncbi:hypothetical protein [Gloeocapsa sp. PCC 73106]|nr:hypothetical protein [Gloeocapsa sp. PCC 73106]ELR96600.1 hypothetical protein GLO73106DRAFT_00003950 [Gloeocapsa sp. PCC 73106]